MSRPKPPSTEEIIKEDLRQINTNGIRLSEELMGELYEICLKHKTSVSVHVAAVLWNWVGDYRQKSRHGVLFYLGDTSAREEMLKVIEKSS